MKNVKNKAKQTKKLKKKHTNKKKHRALPGIEPGPPVPETGILPLN